MDVARTQPARTADSKTRRGAAARWWVMFLPLVCVAVARGF